MRTGNSCLTLGAMVQIFRTEHLSKRLKEGSALPLMSVVVATIAAASIALTAAEHIPETLNWLQHPDQLISQLSMPSWAQVLPVVWSALMSTDLVLLIEVHSFSLAPMSRWVGSAHAPDLPPFIQ